MKKFENVSLFLYAIDETDSMEKIVQTVFETCNLSDIKEIVIVVCSHTTPECLRTAEHLAETVVAVPTRVFWQKRKNIGGALQDSYEIAQGTHFLGLESDLSMDPNLVQVFIEKAKENPDKIITASRWIKGGGFQDYGNVKKIINYCFQSMVSVLYGTKMTDYTYLYQLMPVELLQSIRWEQTARPFVMEVTLKPVRLGVEFVEIPAFWVKRKQGHSSQKFISNLKYLKTVFSVRFMSKDRILKQGSDCVGEEKHLYDSGELPLRK